MLVPRVTEECTLTKASIWTTQMGETFTAAFKVVQLDKALVSVLPTSFLSTHRITLLYFPELCNFAFTHLNLHHHANEKGKELLLFYSGHVKLAPFIFQFVHFRS